MAAPMVIQTRSLTKRILSFEDPPKKACQLHLTFKNSFFNAGLLLTINWLVLNPVWLFGLPDSHRLHYNSPLTTSVGLQEQVLCFNFTESPGALSMWPCTRNLRCGTGYSSQIHGTTTAVTLKKCTAFRGSPKGALKNYSQIVFIDLSLFLIDPVGYY